jgi:hypothetical protein
VLAIRPLLVKRSDGPSLAAEPYARAETEVKSL